MKKTLISLSLALAATYSANAISFSFDAASDTSNPNHTGASATFELNFSAVDSDSILMSVSTKNTTGETAFGDGATTSKYTGLAFMLPDSVTSVSNFIAGTYFDYAFTSGTAMQPFGNFDLGFADNNNFLGGNANNALVQGGSDSFSIVLNFGSNILPTEAENLFVSPPLNAGGWFAGARFQQANAGAGSDKLVIPGTGRTIVPDSGTTLALLGASLLALIGIRSRKN